MQGILSYIIQVNILLVIVYLGYYFLLKTLTFYSFNRMYFIGATLYSFVYPLLDINAWFAQRTDMDVPMLWDYVPLTWSTPEADQSIFTVHNMLLTVVVLGLLVLLFRFVLRLLSLLRIHYYSRLSLWRQYVYQDVLFPIAPFSFLKKIYLHKASHQESELNDIFEHEQMHVKGFHTFDVLLFEIILVCCWYNPFVWYMRRAVGQNLEFLTDQQVLNTGADRHAYQFSLLHVAQQTGDVGLANQFNFSSLKSRIMMMNKNRSSKLEMGKYVFLLPVMLLAGASFTVDKAEGKIEEAVEQVKVMQIDPFIGQLVTLQDSSEKEEKDTLSSPVVTSRAESSHPDPAPWDDAFLNKDILLVIDGKVMPDDFDRKEVEASSIMRVEILKDKAAAAIYGERGRHGVILLTTKSAQLAMRKADPLDVFSDSRVLLVIDGMPMPESYDRKLIDPKNIESVTVLKSKESTAIYGRRAEHGVILIVTKKSRIGVAGEITVTGYATNDKGVRVSDRDPEIKKLKSKSEIDATKEYLFVYDDERVTKADFLSKAEDQLHEMTLINWERGGGENGDASKAHSSHVGQIKAYSANALKELKLGMRKPLLVIDGVRQSAGFDLSKVRTDDIESINVWKGVQHTSKYGEDAKYGVVEVYTKKKPK